MEFLPPPPPHLLHSDDENEDVSAPAGMSVAESVRQLQQKHHNHIINTPPQLQRPGSPATLRRVQSMSAASPPPNIGGNSYQNHHQQPQSGGGQIVDMHSQQQQQRASLKARLDAALSSPRGIRPQSPQAQNCGNGNANEVIYAPVAALQQKIQQQQKTKMAAMISAQGQVTVIYLFFSNIVKQI